MVRPYMSVLTRLLARSVVGIGTLVPLATYAGTQSYQAYAYSSSNDKLLYQESHWLYARDGVGQHLIIYRCPDGQPFGRKSVSDAPGAATPDFEMLDARSGYREGVRTRDGHREVFKQADARSPERSSQVSIRDNSIIDAGIDAFVQAHWDSLSGAGISPVPFLVPSRLGYVDFSGRKLRDAVMDGHDVRWFRMSLDGWYGFALPHLDVGYDVRTHELREYQGPSNIPAKGLMPLTVRIDLPPGERREDVAQAEVEQAAQLPLTGRCAIP